MYRRNKKIAIYSNSWDANAGGGMVYILGLANLLLSYHFDVTVFFFDTIQEDELHIRYNTGDLHIKFIERKPFPLFAQLKFAFKELLHYDIVIQQSLMAPRLTLVRKSFILCDFPMEKIETLSERIRLGSWRQIIANSQYTKHWVLKLWKRTSKVLYPPIEKVLNLPMNKNNDMVCIGRFNQGKRSKRQDIIISCFIELFKSGETNCKLHLIGYVEDRGFVTGLKKQAEGYPVVFHENCPLDKQKDILDQSAFYISACGYNIDEELEPMFVEHYGISVVEAMSHGCIPLVVGKGGHKETVQHKENGYHWDTEAVLKNYIIALISNEPLRQEMSKNAFLKSLEYSYESLAEHIKEIVIK